ncbi:MAG: efflux RND transporter permease subunit, partial [Cyclobacteriaceae bacterium]|nr:efflux RND transporter permease subunit [Cyclobacteriaceae bacterium]
MKKIITIFVKYPFYSKLIVAFLIFSGGIALLNMKKSFFPGRSSREIFVSITYPGASPKEMEEGLTVRIEQAVRGIVGIKEINSTSSENFASVIITTTGEFDIDETLQEVKNSVDAISSFPIDAEKPIIYKRRSNTPAMYLGLSGDVDLITLKKYAQQIEDDFRTSGVISQVSLLGYPPLEISVEVTEETLLRYNLTFDEISRAIAQNNSDISAGMIKSTDEEILIRSRARSVDPDMIGEITIRAKDDGSNLLIRDVANVKMKFADVTNKMLMNGKQAINISINKLATEDLEAISIYCNNYVKEFNSKNMGAKLYITFDFLKILKSRLDLLYYNGGIGLLLVIVSLGLFLSFRLSLWVAWGIPASFLAMFIVANMNGITINMISLFGMILVIGILVDDGIVIGENIFTHFEKGKTPKRAAIDGTMEVLPAVVTSILTTVVAFSPLFLLEGRMEFLYEMAFVVVFSLLFSLLEAFFVLPAHIGTPHVLRSKHRAEKTKNIRKYLEKGVNYLKFNIYGKFLKKMIQWKWVAFSIPLAILFITIGLFKGGIIKTTFFPSIPFDSFNVNISFKPGAGEKQTYEFLKQFDNAVWEVNNELMKEYETSVPYVNFTFLNVGNAFDGQQTGSHAGNIFVLVADLEGRKISSFQIADRVRKKIGVIPEAEKLTVSGRNRWGSPVSISLLGKSLEELKQAKEFLLNGMSLIPSLVNITDNNAPGKREIRLKLKPKAYFLGLNHASISKQIRNGFFGGQAQRLQSGKDEIRVWVRYPKSDRVNIGQLESMKIKTAAGEFPLSELATYTIERGPVSIHRYNGSKEIRIDADLADPYEPVPPIIAQIRRTIIPELMTKYPGVSIQYQGQQKDTNEAASEMIHYFGIAFSLMIIILMIHFKSFSQPMIIIAMIPLAWIGASWGHGFEGIPVSMLSAWGMVALSGVIINDAVVFLAKYNSNLLEGQTVSEAAYSAGIARFRAILLTSITTVAGLYPIV